MVSLFLEWPEWLGLPASLLLAAAVAIINVNANIVSPANDFANVLPLSFTRSALLAIAMSCVAMPWRIFSDPNGYLTKFPATGKNGVCEKCENTGVLVGCYSCNIVWHRGCIPTHQPGPKPATCSSRPMPIGFVGIALTRPRTKSKYNSRWCTP